MKRFSVITVAILLMLFLSAATTSSDTFEGKWKGIDGDGSKLTLQFIEENRSGGLIFKIEGRDSSCSACGGAVAKMNGMGVLDGENSISASTVWWTVPTGDPAFYFNEGVFTYDPDNDTVTDPEGIVYHRKHSYEN